MNRFILTGAPGAGKTAVLRQLEVLGFAVVEEAATDVIALKQATGLADEGPGCIDDIVALQERRRTFVAAGPRGVVFHDRSPVCTLALAEYAGVEISPTLAASLDSIAAERFYERRVFFVRNLGFIKNTEARRISFQDALRFERIHEDVYRRLGYQPIFIEPASVAERARAIVDIVMNGR